MMFESHSLPPASLPPDSASPVRKVKKMTCPICDREFQEDARDAALPFCSKRCKLIDAGRWLGEVYGLPDEKPQNPDETDEA